MADLVLCEADDDGVATVTLNRPDAMNALSIALRADLCAIMERLRDDASVRAIILTGAGERAFCAGLDLKELGSGDAGLGAATDQAPKSNPVRAIELAGKPVVGAINGVAITGGFELALAADILIGSTNARFADTHALVGIMPGWGLSQKLSRIIGLSRAKEMSFTGRFIDATTACDWGLINRVVEPQNLLDAAKEIARAIASIDSGFIGEYRKLIAEGYDMPLTEALAHEQAVSTKCNSALTAGDIEARRASVQSRGRKQV